ncbi:MAG: carboxypeptidase-like regulatory domain-containing protein [Acidobacteriota bacterium]|nr:carboxypeptidase-like regulatory domain-containing protein [Acidobacteriota bacterium]
MRITVYVILTALLLLGGTRLATPQIVSGTIVGTVRDSSGAAMADTKVVVVNTETNQSRESLTNSSGAFSFPTLAAGRYRITATQQGFGNCLLDQSGDSSRVLTVSRPPGEWMAGKYGCSIPGRFAL